MDIRKASLRKLQEIELTKNKDHCQTSLEKMGERQEQELNQKCKHVTI
jgi:hypothetical protein